MSMFHRPYIGYDDGASRSNYNICSSTWEIYTPTNEWVRVAFSLV